MSLKRPLILLAFLFVTPFLLSGCGGDDEESVLKPAQGVAEITRQIIQEGEPASAPGQSLELTRVIIPGGMEIAAHTHPGLQLAVVVEGTLEYTVIEGEVQVIHNSGTNREATDTVVAGHMVELTPGTAVMEVPGMVHAARNRGKKSVVVYLSSLFPTGEPASSPSP